MAEDSNQGRAEPLMENMYVDDKDFLAKYLFDPKVNDNADFKHLDKNLAVTRLSSRYHEPERARSLLSALHVLNNNSYFLSKLIDEVEGYEEVEALVWGCPVCGRQGLAESPDDEVICCEQKPLPLNKATVNRPITSKKLINKSMFPRTYHMLKAMFYAFTTTSMARDGHLIRQATTTHFQQNQTMEDRTKVRGGIFNIGKTQNTNGR